MSETPAETLRRAAKLMRGRAEASTRGPWQAEENEDCWQLFGAVTPNTHPLQLIKAPKHGTPYAEYWPEADTGEHIASWHPGVALVVADLLDVAARNYDELAEGLYGAAGAAFVAGDFGGDVDPALKIARTYLGEETQ